ncbi:MAG: acyl carrier protein [Gammaproteobacteria bacterium]|nr:acyl carrier protein [Gammaproteobacteria bacterium]MBU0770285.1 acyl carrier protein [Gammaproteobacteria bacterium]MBU0856517.1 acyl carrier protein [Gammaproteobacteria bacterium]MBU1845457.1 acyl carrier protein [Gammaproteobacteria bacterium]
MFKHQEIADWITAFIVERTGVPEYEVEPDENLGSYGLGSMQAVDLVGSLEDRFGVALAPTLVFQFPTVRELAAVVLQRVGQALPVGGEA